jgi:hypothetical protein
MIPFRTRGWKDVGTEPSLRTWAAMQFPRARQLAKKSMRIRGDARFSVSCGDLPCIVRLAATRITAAKIEKSGFENSRKRKPVGTEKGGGKRHEWLGCSLKEAAGIASG